MTPKTDHPLGRLQRLLRNTRDCTPEAHTPEDDDAGHVPPPTPLLLGDAVGAVQCRWRATGDPPRLALPVPVVDVALAAGHDPRARVVAEDSDLLAVGVDGDGRPAARREHEDVCRLVGAVDHLVRSLGALEEAQDVAG